MRMGPAKRAALEGQRIGAEHALIMDRDESMASGVEVGSRLSSLEQQIEMDLREATGLEPARGRWLITRAGWEPTASDLDRDPKEIVMDVAAMLGGLA